MDKDDIPEDLWIFGYGSIVWKYDEIHHTHQETGFIRGYRRRLWQSSPDHRGTSEKPGLVASIYTHKDLESLDILKKDNQEVGAIKDDWVVGGRAFRVTQEYRQQVVDDLLHREVNGYKAIFVPIYKWNKERDSTDDGTLITERGLTFQAGIDNESFAGFLSHADIAQRVSSRRGDSGSNAEYVVELGVALDNLGMKDEHVSDIVARVERHKQHVYDD